MDDGSPGQGLLEYVRGCGTFGVHGIEVEVVERFEKWLNGGGDFVGHEGENDGPFMGWCDGFEVGCKVFPGLWVVCTAEKPGLSRASL